MILKTQTFFPVELDDRHFVAFGLNSRLFRVGRRMEEFLVLLIRCCPRVSLSRRLLLVALTLFVVMCLVISIFTFFSDRYNRRDDT